MKGTPLGRHLYFRSRDLEETREMVARVYCDHRLSILQGRSLNAFQYEARLGSLSMSYMQYGERVSIDPGELNSFYLIQMPLRGYAEINTGGTLVRSTPQMASIADPTRGLLMEWSPDCSKLMLKIDRATVTRFLEATLLERLPPRGLIFRPEFDLTTRQGHHWMAIMRLLESYLSHFPKEEHRVRQRPAEKPKLGPLIPVIEAILEADGTAPVKQRHTAKRIFERLRDGHGFTGGYTVVKDHVRIERARWRETFVPLAHPPGHAQVDFGEVVGVIGGVRQKSMTHRRRRAG